MLPEGKCRRHWSHDPPRLAAGQVHRPQPVATRHRCRSWGGARRGEGAVASHVRWKVCLLQHCQQTAERARGTRPSSVAMRYYQDFPPICQLGYLFMCGISMHTISARFGDKIQRCGEVGEAMLLPAAVDLHGRSCSHSRPLTAIYPSIDWSPPVATVTAPSLPAAGPAANSGAGAGPATAPPGTQGR